MKIPALFASFPYIRRNVQAKLFQLVLALSAFSIFPRAGVVVVIVIPVRDVQFLFQRRTVF